MLRCQYQFVVEISGPNGEALGQHRIVPDWSAGVNWLRFEALRQGHENTFIREGDVCVQPKWSERGNPYIDGVILSAPGHEAELPSRYFKSAAVLAAGQLVDQKKLANGDLFTYRVLAYAQGEPPAAPRSLFSFEEEPSPVETANISFENFLRRATLQGERSDEALDVFVPDQVIQEIKAQALHAGKMETGGVLIGHLCRDTASQRLGVEVTAQIPVSGTAATSMSINFTDDTWMAVRRAVELRNRSEVLVGWQHSHPAKHWCPETCPMERRLQCSRQLPFFSSDDVRLHGVVFPAGWQIGLLANHADSGLTVSCFGWDQGLVRQRTYHLLDADIPPASPSPETMKSSTQETYAEECPIS